MGIYHGDKKYGCGLGGIYVPGFIALLTIVMALRKVKK